MDETVTPSYLTDPVEGLARAENLEAAILDAADVALAEFLERVVTDVLDGDISRGSIVGYWVACLEKALTHPTFADVRDELLAELDETFPDDVFTAAQMALEVAHAQGATAGERAELLRALFQHPDPSLVASLSDKVDGWLRRRISRVLLTRIGKLGPDDLENEVFPDYPETPGKATLVTERDWLADDRPGEINWRARMKRDIRTAYTAIFGRQMQRQLERYGFTEKEWVSRKDERTRSTHRHADGQRVGLYEGFHVGLAILRYPGDPTGPIGEVVNCRCVMVGKNRAF